MRAAARWSLLFAALVALPACKKDAAPKAAAKATTVQVAKPVEREVTEFEEFTGRTEATKMVMIRSRVTGYLDRVAFKDGEVVKEGDLLFAIDSRTYKAEVERTEASIAQAEARLTRVRTDFDRIQALTKTRSASREELDRVVGDLAEAEAAVKVAKASNEMAAVNLGYTRVTAPIGGRISYRAVDPGNLVKADDTMLTTLVTLDPIYAYFDVDERTLLVQLAKLGGQSSGALAKKIAVEIGLTSEEGFSLKGDVDFIDNRVDASTGTIRARAVVPNPSGLLKPGLFIRARMPVTEPRKQLLIPEQSLMSDQGNRYVYLAGNDNKVVQRPVQVGSQQGGLRVITQGVALGDRVLTTGLQRVKPGAAIEPKDEFNRQDAKQDKDEERKDGIKP